MDMLTYGYNYLYGVVLGMVKSGDYSRYFSRGKGSFVEYGYELARDCFGLAAKYSKANAGMLLLVDEEYRVICAYNLGRASFEEAYAGCVFEKADDAACMLLGIDEEKAILLCGIGVDNETLQTAAGIIEDSHLVSRRHSKSGDMVLRALDNVNDAISYCDSRGKVKYANKACFEILGTNKEELYNGNLEELTTGKPMLLEILKNKKSIIDVEYFLKYKDRKFHFINSGYPVYSDSGQVIGAIDIFRSIERSRKLANSIAGYQAFFTFGDIQGSSRKMHELVEHAKVFARSDETVLILGESGTGKELIAQSMHNYSDRAEGPFIALNCANFPNELIDSELFGYEEGAFTGAQKGGKQGKFELASGGTIFLDEIGEMQLHLQAKLLRVLETMCVTRIGGNNPVKIDVRVVAATNRRLEELAEAGDFRRDLYYRLKVLLLETPPLRERGEDIILLAEYFIGKIAAKTGKNIARITAGAKEMLLNYSWPGNVRELENAMSRAIFMCVDDEIDEKTLLKGGIRESRYDEVVSRSSVNISRDMLSETMMSMEGNKKKAAEFLGISRPTLYKLLKKYDIKFV